MSRRKTTEEFIEEANRVHNGKYTYEHTVYKNSSSKVTVTCPIHGDFEVPAWHHIHSKSGCRKCNGNYQMNTTEFIQRAKEIHGNKYDYSKSEYANKNTKVCIICPKHGEFWQKAEDHYSGHGCRKCYEEWFVANQTFPVEVFLKKAKERFGDKYIYDLSKYETLNSIITITCPEHGTYEQVANTHLETEGCPRCGRLKANKTKSLTQEEFIRKCKEIHGNKYDYSKVNYINGKSKVCIICPIHGDFWVSPHSHVNSKTGCPKCNSRYIDTELFVQRAQDIHGDKYDYSNTIYTKSDKPVEIICKKHGVFKQSAIDHLRGHGCPKCGNEKSHLKTTCTVDDFIKKARNVHDDKYTYDTSIYINSKRPIEITCPIHGPFWQTPNDHLDGRGCPKCNPFYKLTTETFIEKAVSKHGNKFDYSKVEYINSNTKVCIICPIHGEFWQIPSNHLYGQQCPKCKTKGQEQLFRKLLEYFPNENFQWEYRSEWLDKQIIDIYLEKYKIAIEYDGLQHYQPIEFFGGKNAFLIQQDADRRKEQKCLDNGVLLIRVKYGEIEKDFTNICDIITSRIKNYGNM